MPPRWRAPFRPKDAASPQEAGWQLGSLLYHKAWVVLPGVGGGFLPSKVLCQETPCHSSSDSLTCVGHVPRARTSLQNGWIPGSIASGIQTIPLSREPNSKQGPAPEPKALILTMTFISEALVLFPPSGYCLGKPWAPEADLCNWDLGGQGEESPSVSSHEAPRLLMQTCPPLPGISLGMLISHLLPRKKC